MLASWSPKYNRYNSIYINVDEIRDFDDFRNVLTQNQVPVRLFPIFRKWQQVERQLVIKTL